MERWRVGGGGEKGEWEKGKAMVKEPWATKRQWEQKREKMKVENGEKRWEVGRCSFIGKSFQ